MPVRLWNMHSFQKTMNNTHEMSVFTFRHSILFRGIWIGKLLKNTLLIKLGSKRIGHILPPIIKSNISHSSIVLGFNHLKELNKQR